MKPIAQYRFPAAATCTDERLIAGRKLAAILGNFQVPNHSPLKLLQLVRPRSENLFKAFRTMDIDEFFSEKDCLLVPSPMARHLRLVDRTGKLQRIRIPRPKGLKRATVSAFLSASDNDLLEELSLVSGESVGLLRMLTRGRPLEALEAVEVTSGFPQGILAMYSFMEERAQPSGTSRIEIGSPTDWAGKYPSASSLTGNCRKILSQERGSIADLTGIFEDLVIPDGASQDDRSIVRAMEFYANRYLTNPEHYRRTYRELYSLPAPKKAKTTLPTSNVEILGQLPAAYEVVAKSNFSRRVTGGLRGAVCVVVSSGVVKPHPDFTGFFEIPLETTSAERPLITPTQLFELYDLGSDYPILPSTIADPAWAPASLRVLKIILVECMQRSASLVSFRLSHILTSRFKVDIYIERSKTGFVNTSIAAWTLLSLEDIQFLRDFKSAALAAGFNSDTSLAQLAGLGADDSDWARLAQKNLASELARSSPSAKSDYLSTHLPRATGLSWAPVRALLCHYPEMRDSPLLGGVIDHPWFSEERIARFKRLIPGESTATAEIYRRIACWTTPHEFVHSYCRNWQLLTGLHRERLQTP